MCAPASTGQRKVQRGQSNSITSIQENEQKLTIEIPQEFRRRHRSVYKAKIQIITSYLQRLHSKLGHRLPSFGSKNNLIPSTFKLYYFPYEL